MNLLRDYTRTLIVLSAVFICLINISDDFFKEDRKMKRRQQDPAKEADTVKISKFFQTINTNHVNNDNRSALSSSCTLSSKRTTPRKETLKKSIQVSHFIYFYSYF